MEGSGTEIPEMDIKNMVFHYIQSNIKTVLVSYEV